MLAGIKFLLRDKLLGPLSGTVIVLNFLGAGLSAALPFYAYDSFSGDSKVAGLFFTAMGAGALLGSVGAVLVDQAVPADPARRARRSWRCRCRSGCSRSTCRPGA